MFWSQHQVFDASALNSTYYKDEMILSTVLTTFTDISTLNCNYCHDETLRSAAFVRASQCCKPFRQCFIWYNESSVCLAPQTNNNCNTAPLLQSKQWPRSLSNRSQWIYLRVRYHMALNTDASVVCLDGFIVDKVNYFLHQHWHSCMQLYIMSFCDESKCVMIVLFFWYRVITYQEPVMLNSMFV